MKYISVLDQQYKETIETACIAPKSKIEFVGSYIFYFTTYSPEIDILLAERMIRVIEAIVFRRTFEFIATSDESHIEYITMCNMPFLIDKLEWGTSIRGAWMKDFACEINDIPIDNFQDFCFDLIKWVKS
jgi:hypothetical protein